MIPRTLSATAIKAYENCPAGYKATYIDQAREYGVSTQGDLGSACHHAMYELLIEDKVLESPDLNALL